jgi:hypothetical protein
VFFATQESAAPRRPGVVEVTSDPAGAAILLDGHRREERTPAVITGLPLGHYAVTIAADGFAPFRAEIDLTEGAPRSRVEAALERPSATALGAARIESTPTGARVLLDGSDTGQVTPATISGIEPGVQHAIALSLDGWVTASETWTAQPGEVANLRIALERTPLAANEHLITITVDPPEARVQLDTEWHRGGSPYALRVEARRYRLRVARDGFRTHERDITLAGGETSELTIDLERDARPRCATSAEPAASAATGAGQVTIDARPWCDVTLDGRSLGQTPIVGRSVPPGRHTVVCTNPELDRSRTVQIEVRSGETTRTRIALD